MSFSYSKWGRRREWHTVSGEGGREGGGRRGKEDERRASEITSRVKKYLHIVLFSSTRMQVNQDKENKGGEEGEEEEGRRGKEEKK